jgi:beta-1,4-mannosyltransferase
MQYIYRTIIFLLTACIFISLYAFQELHSVKIGYFSQFYNLPLISDHYFIFILLSALPFALCLWFGWIFFLQSTPWKIIETPKPFPGQLIIRYVTRGVNVEALRRSVHISSEVLKKHGLEKKVHIQVISDKFLSLPPEIELVVVPHDFETPQHSLFKARALYYAQMQYPLNDHQWILHLDEESKITDSCLQGISKYIEKHYQDAKPPIGQGPIVYIDGHWFWCGADAMRLADDLGRFKLQYQFGIPIFGVHGSYLLIRGDVDKALPFDVGRDNSYTEDTAWALLAWQKGYRFNWINGFILEQPPCNLKDFLKQRQRWLAGMKMVIKSPKIQWRFKFVVSIFIYLWQISFFTILLTFLTLAFGLSVPTFVKIAGDFCLSIFFSSYLIGNAVTCYITKRPWVMLTSILYPIYSLLESIATLLAFNKLKSFYVVKK